MATRESYAPGTFSWTDLTTTDAAGAKAFYGGLFGWEFEDMPAGEGAIYSMASLDGRLVAALSEAQERPTAWSSYITVEDADASAARAADLGATAPAGPFDVFDAGRMAVISDPQGAVFSVWQPGRMHGAGLVNAPGALSWDEIWTPDPEATVAFYGELFGWTFEDLDGYRMIRNGGRGNGGVQVITEDMAGIPPHWSVIFGTADAAASQARIDELGGTIIRPAFEIGVGRVLVATDPQGAPFVLFEGEFEA